MKILMVLTSHDELGTTGHKTGFWLEEFAAPYYVFKDAGAEITLASPKGGATAAGPEERGEGFPDPGHRTVQQRCGGTGRIGTYRSTEYGFSRRL